MRIIAGSLGGRLFASPRGHRTHPMSDKVRGALFNILGDITGLTVLDAFAGTGALGFEAISRGAKSAILVERDRSAQKTLYENIVTLGLEDQVSLVSAGAGPWLRSNKMTFDIVLLDPPYDALQVDLLELLIARVKPDGRIVLSWPGKTEVPRIRGVVEISHKNYGDASLYIFRPQTSAELYGWPA